MPTPEERKRDLTRALIDELETEDVQRAASDPSWRVLARNLSLSRLWPLRCDEPLGQCLTGDPGLPAKIVRQVTVDLRDESLPVTARRSPDAAGVQLRIGGLPAGWQPVAIIVLTNFSSKIRKSSNRNCPRHDSRRKRRPASIQCLCRSCWINRSQKLPKTIS